MKYTIQVTQLDGFATYEDAEIFSLEGQVSKEFDTINIYSPDTGSWYSVFNNSPDAIEVIVTKDSELIAQIMPEKVLLWTKNQADIEIVNQLCFVLL